MNVENAPNSSLLNTKTTNLINTKTNNLTTDRKRKNSEIMERENKHLKSNYYSVLDIEDDFERDESSLTKFKAHVQKKTIPSLNHLTVTCSHNVTTLSNHLLAHQHLATILLKELSSKTQIQITKTKTKKYHPSIYLTWRQMS